MVNIITSSTEINLTLSNLNKIEQTIKNSGRGKSFDGTSTTIANTIELGDFRSTFGGKSNISIHPTENNFCSVIAEEGKQIPIELGNISSAHHRLNVVEGKEVQLGILEHINSVSSALGVNFNIDIKGKNSWPTLDDSIHLFASKISDNLVNQEKKFKYFTVKKPVKIDFGDKRGAYIMLFPDNGDNKLILDLSIKYPGKSIGEQRIVFEINDEDYLKYVSKARTNAFGIKEKLLKFSNSKFIPTDFIRDNFLDFGYDNVLAFNKDKIINPKDNFKREDGIYTEVIYHNVLDLLGALGIDSKLDGETGFRFVGKVVAFANSHEQDLKIMNMMKNGDISIKKL